ncbi:sigma 54-interacting transcriptional regulator [Actinobacillus arthritidis]|uniref:sigma 54-interacting transcriptional regulator n=1 Tax=Actinobacillus arthritidis TaxID=157339 RepID=UPI00244172EF|nr:sigma 54-interacting transcriptional regulator [Actinobacillus arthritidis]WGE90207.1 sigma 54-interacting transcriptional regulator [Actinobacillus arthritidis]
MKLRIECSDKLTVAEKCLHLLAMQKQSILQIEFTEFGVHIEFSSLTAELQTQILAQIRPLEGVLQAEFMEAEYHGFENMIAQSPKMQAVIEQAKKFAMLKAPLLIQGETGTGKDVFAKACHELSSRRAHKFIAVNCAGLPADEAETEMFGHRGNGKENIGFFEYANGGTVLLDSIAELSLEMQAKLLRFLNDGCFRRVGEDQEIQVDVRVICTSQKPLNLLVEEGKVREDLYHRLNVLTLDLPPLRDRQEDLPLLADHFIAQISQQLGISKLEYDNDFVTALQSYRWPGNLRELYNAIYRACTLSHSYRLAVKDLNLPHQQHKVDTLPVLDEGATLEELVNNFEVALLRKFYAEFPSTRKLAQRLGISHTAVANKLRAYGIGK